MNEYPKWVYHGKLGSRIVEDPAEHEALGPGWVETPAPAAEDAAEEAAPQPKKAGKK